MKSENKFRIGRMLCGTDEADQPSVKYIKSSAEQALSSVSDRAQTGNNHHRGRKPMVAFLIGALMVMLGVIAAPTPSSAHVSLGIFVNFGPPALPVYAQPACPAPGYIWTPGYWAWDPGYGYYWVPGTWVLPPFAGALWTPGYWDYNDGGYRWHGGYWGMSVGWYGGIDYGFGYDGDGYHGGYWHHDRFYYNRAVNRIDGGGFHYYYRRENRHFDRRRASYHGGPGGVRFGPTREQRAVAGERHFAPVRRQVDQRQFARRDPMQRARMNHGRPQIAATRRAGYFRGNGVTYARRAGTPYRAPVQRMHGRQFQRSAPQRFGNNNRGFRSFRSPHNTRNFSQRRYQAPVQRMSRQPVYRNNQRAFQHFQRQPHAQQMRGFRGHAAEVRRSPAPHGQWHGHQGGHGNDGGHGHGRGGRH